MKNKHLILPIFLSIYSLVLPLTSAAQEDKRGAQSSREKGIPYVQNFGPDDYNSHIENQAIVQDQRGVMYFGNIDGVLEYDGVTWRKIVPNQATPNVYSLAVDNTNTVFVGGRSELGYLAADAKGEMQYVSLLDQIPENKRAFSQVRQTLVVGNRTYFFTAEYIFQWSGGRFKVFEPPPPIQMGAVVKDSIYVNVRNIGLMRLDGGSLSLLPNGELFANESIYTMLPYDEETILIGAGKRGLFHYNGESITPFSTEADAYLVENRLNHSTWLPNGHLALGTLRGGIAVIDNRGRLLQILNRASGLRNEEVRFTYVDREGILWLALNNGISKVEMDSPFTIFTANQGIEGSVNAMVRHDGIVYAATTVGVYYMQPASSKATQWQPSRFEPVPDLKSVSWALIAARGVLLAGTSDGIFEIGPAGAKSIESEASFALCFYHSVSDINRIYVGLQEGLATLEFRNGRWQYAGQFTNIKEEVRTITEEDDGSIWLGTTYQGLLKIEASSLHENGFNAQANRYGKEEGFPHSYTNVFTVNGQTVFATLNGLWHYDKAQQSFLPDSTFGPAFADTTRAFSHVIEDHSGSVWMRTMYDNKLTAMLADPMNDGTYRAVVTPLLPMRDIGDLWSVYPDTTGIVWFGGSDGIARFDATIKKDHTIDFTTLIRRIATVPSDSLIYGGTSSSQPMYPSLPYKENSLRLEYAATSYDGSVAKLYQYKLEGFDPDWSPWTTEAKKDYTNISAGSYTFRVRAQNIYKLIGEEAIFAFKIQPPWHRTWFAYLLYGMIGIGLVSTMLKRRVRHLEKKTMELEALVAERTATISEQAEKLKALDQMKSRFFANISHEFRTPLTLILGPIEKRLTNAQDSDKDELSMMHRSARRVLELINQMLDLSRLESGKMDLQVQPGEICFFAKGIVMSFASLSQEKNIAFHTSIDCEGFNGVNNAYFDADKVEKILSNLLSNAFKFTPAGGRVSVELEIELEDKLKDEHLPANTSTKSDSPNYINITVKNTGPGIPEDRLPFIFDRFYQGDASATRSHEGTGIGLALTKELVERHYGTIDIQSNPAETAFGVRLPVGRAHFNNQEIVAPPTQSLPANATQLATARTSLPVANSQPAETTQDDAPIALIVDDHVDVRSYIRSCLADEYTIIEAIDGHDGVKTAKDAIPDIVISDVMMPKMDGYELCSVLKVDERTSHIPVILLTAKAREEDKISGLETGADDYLVKPFNARELQIRVRNLIEQRQKLRERFVRQGMLRPRELEVMSVDDTFLHRLMETIETHMTDEHFGVEELNASMGIGARQLYRKIHALTGKSPVKFIRLVRLQRAKRLLEQKAGNVSEVAFEVGFSSLSYFSKTFKEEFGKLPSEL
ncbi:MAG: response regulator [Rhodothermales bacterium]